MASRADAPSRLDPIVRGDLRLLEGITSFREAFMDPALTGRMQELLLLDRMEPPERVLWHDVEHPDGCAHVGVRIYEPDADEDAERPVLVWVHGGGFEIGSAKDPGMHGGCAVLADASGATVVSVEYRLAVDGRHYPDPLDDVVDAIRWVRRSIEALHGDPDRVSVAGDSAGGNLAAGAVLRLRDEDEWVPAALITVYPIVHPVLPAYLPELTAAMAGVPDLLRFLPDEVARMNRNYLGGSENTADGYAMPGLADLRGLCPVLIIDAECDDLRASGEAFAAALIRDGVDVQLVTARGMAHGFLMSARLRQAAEARGLIARTVSSARSAAS